jgi:hypothetical protein
MLQACGALAAIYSSAALFSLLYPHLPARRGTHSSSYTRAAFAERCSSACSPHIPFTIPVLRYVVRSLLRRPMPAVLLSLLLLSQLMMYNPADTS